MRIPSFKEFQLEATDVVSIEEAISSCQVGEQPFYLMAHQFDKDALDKLLSNISRIFKFLKIDPHFPYPFYVVTELLHDHEFFPIANSLGHLPDHFKVKIKKLRHKELDILQKTRITAEKIRNKPIIEKIKSIESSFSNHKELYELCKETQFYQEIHEGLHDK